MTAAISDTEWKVMRVVWETNPISANDIVERLEREGSTWKPKTVKTLIGRLVGKRALGFKKDLRSFLYYPLIGEKEAREAETRSFVDKVYSGSTGGMLAFYLENRKLSAREIDELKSILDSASAPKRRAK